MAYSESRLKGFTELTVGHMLMELGGSCSFLDFTEERKVGDQAVVVEVMQVLTWFLEDNGD